MRMPRRAAIVAAAATIIATQAGCASVVHCLGNKNDDKYQECVADEDARAAAEKRQRKEDQRRRAEYEEVKPSCDRGDPHACLTVGEWGKDYRGDPAETARAFAVACAAALVDACVDGGHYAYARGDGGAALAAYRRGCELRDSRGCVGAAQLDPANAMALETSACDLGDFGACYWVAKAHLDANRPADAEPYLELCCQHGDTQACADLGKLDSRAPTIGPPP